MVSANKPVQRQCGRAFLPPLVPRRHWCAAPAVLHVATRERDGKVKFMYACREHVENVLLVSGVLQHHELGPYCGMPGAGWDFEENECRLADGLPEATPRGYLKGVTV